MRLVEYEAELKKMIKEDVKNPKVYIAIYELIYRWLLREKHIFDRQKVADIACNMAEDLYMKVYFGGTITSWIGYINKSFSTYLRLWYKDHVKEQMIEIPSFSFELALVEMYASSTLYDDSLAKIVNTEVINSIPRLIEGVLKDSRYFEDTPEYLNARATLLLSLILGEYTSFRQTEADRNYTRVLYRIFLDKLSLELAPSDENTFSNAIAFQQAETTDYLAGGGEQWMNL